MKKDFFYLAFIFPSQVTVLCLFLLSTPAHSNDELKACINTAKRGLLNVAEDPSTRFLGKVAEDTARCRGGEKAVKYRYTPWIDWQNYYSAGDASTRKDGSKAKTKLGEHLFPNGRGIDGALMDLEYQRIELIKFNLFDQETYDDFVTGVTSGVKKFWPEMRLPSEHPEYNAVGGEGKQLCEGAMITHRTLSGVCNDLINPLMGSTNTPFARNTRFESNFPRLGKTELTKNRHGDRLGLLKPDPQLISRKLFTRTQSENNGCNQGLGNKDFSTDANCDYIEAPFFNVLAAFWIQFMTHDWFSHTDEGTNTDELKPVGCDSAEAKSLGCRPNDRYEASIFVKTD